MSWKSVSSDSPYEKAGTYSRALYDAEWVFVSGTTGFDYKTMTISDDFSEQARQTWRNITDALRQAGSDLDEIVSYVIYVTDRSVVRTLQQIHKEILPHRPTGTLVCAQLVDERMKIEITVTAKRKSTVKPYDPSAQR